MSKKKKGGKNPYMKDGKSKGFIQFDKRLSTKGDVKNTAIETGKDILIGAIGGGLIAAVIGKPSMLVGIGMTGAGHYLDNGLLKILGIGVMASNGLLGQSGYSKDAIMSRVQSLKGNISEKLFIDKLLGKKGSEDAGTSGMGEVQFFNYPNDMSEAYKELSGELDSLNNLHRNLIRNGMTRMEQMEGMMDMEGVEDVGDIDGPGTDASELNL